MKLLAAFIIALLASNLLSAKANADTFTIGRNGDSIFSHLVQPVLEKAYAKIGHSLEFKSYPSKRSLMLANKGELDGEMVRILSTSQQYQNLIAVPEFITLSPIVAITNKPNISIKSWDDLKGRRFGFLNGILIIEQKTKGLDSLKVNTNEDLFFALNAGRVDVIVTPLPSILDRLSNLKENQSYLIQKPALEITKLFHFLNKQHADTIPKLSQAIGELRNSGFIDDHSTQFYAKYNVDLNGLFAGN